MMIFIRGEQKINHRTLDEIYNIMPNSYSGTKQTISLVLCGSSWTNINIDKEIKEYLNMKDSV